MEALVGLLATILVSLKNSKGQPLIGTAAATAITAGESVVTSIVADIQAARASGASGTVSDITVSLQAVQALLAALASSKVLSPNTIALIGSLDTALQAALAAEQHAQTVTDPSTLTPIPAAV